MSLRLPNVSNAAEFELHCNGAVWGDAAHEICGRHRLAHAALRRSPQGENIIFFVDEEYVVKIFSPSRDTYRREAAALEFARGKPAIRTPELLHAGEIEGWPYLVMRLMLLTILYECSDLRKYALRLDPGAINLTLDQLERAIWRLTTD
jgi:hypothetical protein